ncbi:MAG: PAS domain-containing protein, partial [Planctomycetota bacterium]
MDKQTNYSGGEEQFSSAEQQLKAANQQLRASEQQLQAANQQLAATIRQLRVSEQRYALAQRAANIGTWESNLQSGEVTWAGQTHSLFGFAPDEFAGTRDAFYELVHPDERRYVAEAVETCLEENKPYRFEHRIVRADGGVRWVSEMADVFKDEKGRASRLVGIAVDITNRKQAEDALKAANQQLRASEQQLKAANQQLQASEQQLKAANQQLQASEQQLRGTNQQLEASNRQLRATEKQLRVEKERSQKYFDLAGTIMIIINPERKVSLVNRKGCEILGCEEDEIVGRNWFEEFLPESVREKTKLTFDQLMSGKAGLMEYNENLVLTKNGEERIIDWHNTVITDDAGNIVEVLASGM